MLTGRRAFKGEDVSDTLAFILNARAGLDDVAIGHPDADSEAGDERALLRDIAR